MIPTMIGGDGKVGDKEFIIIQDGEARVLDPNNQVDRVLAKRADVELRVVDVVTTSKYRYPKLTVKFLKNKEHPDTLEINGWALKIERASWQSRSSGLFSSDHYHPVIITDPHGFTLDDEIHSHSFNVATQINRLIEMSQYQSIDRYKIAQLEKELIELKEEKFSLDRRLAKIERKLGAEKKE